MKNILFTFTLIAVCTSGSLLAQNNSSPARSVIARGNYPVSGTLVEALSSITTDSIHSTTVTQGSAVHFIAREQIVLKPGFKAVEGAKFLADIDTSESAVDNPAATDARVKEFVGVLPNPFRRSFNISISTEKNARAQITVYNLLGKKVGEQKNVNVTKGMNRILFDGTNLASGTYLLEINFGDSKLIHKIIKNN